MPVIQVSRAPQPSAGASIGKAIAAATFSMLARKSGLGNDQPERQLGVADGLPSWRISALVTA